MKADLKIYPYNILVKKLPIYLTGIGYSEYQGHALRPDGYHWHQILFSAVGNGVLKFDNVVVPIEEGDYFFLPIGYPHEYYTENEKWEVRWTAFDGFAMQEILEQFDMTKPVVIKPQESDALQNIFRKMLTAQKSDLEYGDHACSGLIYEYIIEFHRLMNTRTSKSRNERNRILIPVLNYIEENFSSDFSLTVLAEQAGVSPQHLCRVFKQTMNMRPNEYLTQRRLREAKSLIQQNRLSISEIARRTGFLDAGYFSTVFKKHEQLTPNEYKKHIGVK